MSTPCMSRRDVLLQGSLVVAGLALVRARVSLIWGRWLLPWTAVLLVSASLAYAMRSAIAGGASASDQPADLQLAMSTGEATGVAAHEQATTLLSAASADLGRCLAPEPCAAIGGGPMGVGVDWWIVAESRKVACEPSGP